MKVFLIILAAVIFIFAAIQIYAMSSRKGIESYPYTVLKTYNDFEIRAYEASMFTSVKLTTNNYKQGSSQGFRVLAGYIFGGNNKEEKIAMTSPVAMSLEDSMTVMFMVPRDIKKDDLPTPNNKLIKFEEMPAKKMAAITFGGWATDERIATYKKQLIAALDKEGISRTNRFYFFGYNAPYDMLDRKNEVIVELD